MDEKKHEVPFSALTPGYNAAKKLSFVGVCPVCRELVHCTIEVVKAAADKDEHQAKHEEVKVP